jgi:hypothetical protein
MRRKLKCQELVSNAVENFQGIQQVTDNMVSDTIKGNL